MQERVTYLFENTDRVEPEHSVYESQPFTLEKDGTFVDFQTNGSFNHPLPEQMLQILRQEIFIDSQTEGHHLLGEDAGRRSSNRLFHTDFPKLRSVRL